MNTKLIPIIAIAGASLAAVGVAFAAQDRFTLTVPNGLAFAEFKGYEDWQDVAVSETESSVKAILANRIMMKAFREGVPGNGKAFPEGSKIVKIEWIKKKNPVSPYFVEVPDYLKNVDLIEKDSKRFPQTNGWAYAQFTFDPASNTFKPSALSASGHECGYACHTIAKANDYIFTAYPKR
jgi:Cytochrome P460